MVRASWAIIPTRRFIFFQEVQEAMVGMAVYEVEVGELERVLLSVMRFVLNPSPLQIICMLQLALFPVPHIDR
jgi:hypothetical protein